MATHMNKSLSHMWVVHATHVDESCHTFGWGMSHRFIPSYPQWVHASCHIWMSRVTRMNESWSAYSQIVLVRMNLWILPIGTWVMSHIRMIYVPSINESWHTYEGVLSHTYEYPATPKEPYLLACSMCDTTHSYAWYDSFISVKWLTHTCDMNSAYVWHDMGLVHACQMAHLYVISMWAMSHERVYVLHSFHSSQGPGCAEAVWMSHVRRVRITQFMRHGFACTYYTWDMEYYKWDITNETYYILQMRHGIHETWK